MGVGLETHYSMLRSEGGLATADGTLVLSAWTQEVPPSIHSLHIMTSVGSLQELFIDFLQESLSNSEDLEKRSQRTFRG